MWQSLYISNCCFIASTHIHYSNVYIYYNTIKGFFCCYSDYKYRIKNLTPFEQLRVQCVNRSRVESNALYI